MDSFDDPVAPDPAWMADPAVAAWLQPLDEDGPCGPDLEYDNDFLALEQAAAGKPETQFSPAEPPDWPAVRGMAEALNERSRDLRVARYWLRARLRLEGLSALAPGLQVFNHLLTTWWDELHPRLDDGDAFARLNVLAELGSLDALLGDVRQSWVLNDRSIGQVSVRDVELALGQLIGRDDESPPSRDQLESMLRDAAEADPSVSAQVPEALAALDALDECLSTRVGYGERPDFSALRGMLESVQAVSPSLGSSESSGDTDDLLASLGDGGSDDSGDDEPAPRRGRGGGRGEMGSIESRADAVRAIGLVCDYLERHEPTNPAANLLRRAQRLIDRNFLQLVREFAPDAVNEVARILGVDPDSIEPSSY